MEEQHPPELVILDSSDDESVQFTNAISADNNLEGQECSDNGRDSDEDMP